MTRRHTPMIWLGHQTGKAEDPHMHMNLIGVSGGKV